MEIIEYDWVKQTRQILFAQCRMLSEQELVAESNFGFLSIKATLVYIAGCYHAWIGSFFFAQTKTPIRTEQQVASMTFDDIEQYFEEADAYVANLFSQGVNWDEPIEQELPWRADSGIVRKSLRQLLMHTVTHEFHHKGQIVAMLRQLGHAPQNTDILGLA